MRSWAGVVALALTVTACAEPEGPPVRNGHVRFDRPGETSVGFPDEEGGPRRPREQLFISPSGKPFRAPMGQAYPVAAWFAEADANHDGRITLEEFRADADAWFKVLDTNGDGQISMPEVTHWEEVLVPEIARDASGLGGGFGGGGRGGRGAPSRNELDTRRQGAAAYSLVNEPHPIRGADSDFDLSVSRAEWRAAADRRFALLDADHDGAITLAELKPTPAQRGAAAQKDGGQGPGSPQGQGPQRQRRR